MNEIFSRPTSHGDCVTNSLPPDEIATKLGAYSQIGVQRVYLQLLDMSDLDHLEFFTNQVIPQVG